MTTVKGSKQYQMVVVPFRPYYKAGMFCVCVAMIAALNWLTYSQGLTEGLATKIEAVKEREEYREQLTESLRIIKSLRQDVAALKLGGKVDSKANEDIRQTVESLQDQIAELNEQVGFYKGVMLPNAEEKGLRIERFDIKSSNEPDTYNFSLLLTQIVEKHAYVQGGVEIKVVGQQGGSEKELSLNDLSSDTESSIRFRFKYYQNIDGELTVPQGFQPRQVMVVARSSGRNTQRLEKKFDWLLDGD